MDTHPLVWLQQCLGADLEAAGLRPTEQRYDPDCFGSGFALYADTRTQLRMVWDGKERAARLEQRAVGATEWTCVAVMLTEGGLEGAVIDHAKVDPWRAAIRKLWR